MDKYLFFEDCVDAEGRLVRDQLAFDFDLMALDDLIRSA